METLFNLVLFISGFVLSSLEYAQNNISSEFYHTWLRYEYYIDICSGKTPRESMKEEPIMQLYFFESKNKVLIGSFSDGMTRDFTIKNIDTILVFNLYNAEIIDYTISLNHFENETILRVNDGKKTLSLIGLDKKYYRRDGVDCFINDKFITGDYISLTDSTLKVSFYTDGGIKGLKNYYRYWIPNILYELPKDFNTIEFIYKQNGRNFSEVFHWKKHNDSIIFYNLEKSSDPLVGFEYRNAKILDKYLELKKIK